MQNRVSDVLMITGESALKNRLKGYCSYSVLHPHGTELVTRDRVKNGIINTDVAEVNTLCLEHVL